MTTKQMKGESFNDAQLDAIWRGAWRLSPADEQVTAIYESMLSDLLPLPHEQRELQICALDRQYFIEVYCQIYDPELRNWLAFHLWPEQVDVLEATIQHKLLVELKARQLGLTWLNLAIILWEMIFRPIAKILLFSMKEDESTYLLGEERLRGMYNRLPEWMRPGIAVDNVKTFELANGSNAHAFAASAADGRTATFALVDEAERVPDLDKLLRSVQPTIDAGGKLVLLSVSLKEAPKSIFKNIYRAARDGTNDWHSVFLAWSVHPDRDQAWYEKQVNDSMQKTGSIDTVYEQYPATDEEALAPASLDKRLPFPWVVAQKCYDPLPPIPDDDLPETCPYINGLRVFKLPEPGHVYVAGMDTAEGLSTSDDSATTWLDRDTGEEVANLVGKFSAAVQANHSVKISKFFNGAKIMIENNNHGHSAILWMDEKGYSGLMLKGQNENKWGWTTNASGKMTLYDDVAEVIRNHDFLIHDKDTLNQLVSVETGSLSAPKGEMDDRAISVVLANIARKYYRGESIPMVQARANWGDNQRRSRPTR